MNLNIESDEDSLIAGFSKNWRRNLKRFKKVTTGHYIIMGRNTYESIGKPLPNRTTIIITRNKNYFLACTRLHSCNTHLVSFQF